MTASPSAFQPLSEPDRELLSAYIDQQLSAVERQALERRLEQEPALRRELEELQTTIALLRDLPALELPRSFMLDPAMAPKRRGFWQQLLPFGGGLVGVALVMLIGVTFFGAAGGGIALAPRPPAEMAEPGYNAQETAPLISATSVPLDEQAAAEAATAGEMSLEEEAAVGEMAAEEAADAAESAAASQAAPEAALPAAPETAADAPPVARLGDSAEDTGSAAPPALQPTPPPPATSESTSPNTLDLPAEPSPAASQPAATPQSSRLPALLGAGVAAAGMLLGLWLARQRRSR
jgi:anti-sigma factor RsiW